MDKMSKQKAGKPRGGLARGLREGVLIALLAVLPALALCANDRSEAGSRHSQPGVPADALWIDARPAAEYAREHVPGAINLNDANWDKELASLYKIWRPSRPIVVYCSTHCWSAAEIAARLDELGIKPVQVFAGGFEEWKRSKS